MPIYEFECQSCGEPFEELVRSTASIDDITCPRCGADKTRKKISMFASKVRGGASFSFSNPPSCSTGST